MLIKTQSNLCVVSFEKMHSISIEENDEKIYIVANSEIGKYILGQYSSLNIAKRVLDNLLRDYKEMYFDTENDYWYVIYEMPQYQ